MIHLNDECLHDYRPKTQNQYERPYSTAKVSDITIKRPETVATRLPTPLSPLSPEEKSLFKTKLRIPNLAQQSPKVDSINKVLDRTLSPNMELKFKPNESKFFEEQRSENKFEIAIFNNPRIFTIKKDFQQNYKVTLNKKKVLDDQNKLLTIDQAIRKNKNKLMVLTDEDENEIRYCFVSRYVV